MDDWHQRLSSQLLGTEPLSLSPTAAAQLEIAFGFARTEVSYLLGLAHTARLPVTGSVLGDDVGVQLGTTVLRFVLSRAEGSITVFIPGQEAHTRLRWDPTKQSMVLPEGQAIDMREFVRQGVEATVAAYKEAPPPPAFSWGPGKPQQG